MSVGRLFHTHGATTANARSLNLLRVRGVLWPNGWMDQDETWHAGRTRP